MIPSDRNIRKKKYEKLEQGSKGLTERKTTDDVRNKGQYNSSDN